VGRAPKGEKSGRQVQVEQKAAGHHLVTGRSRPRQTNKAQVWTAIPNGRKKERCRRSSLFLPIPNTKKETKKRIRSSKGGCKSSSNNNNRLLLAHKRAQVGANEAKRGPVLAEKPLSLVTKANGYDLGAPAQATSETGGGKKGSHNLFAFDETQQRRSWPEDSAGQDSAKVFGLCRHRRRRRRLFLLS
jgi:hypothetical protein